LEWIILGYFWGRWDGYCFGIFWNILRPSAIFCGPVFWYVVPRNIWQPWPDKFSNESEKSVSLCL
jgi:hypothetical protein